MNPALRKPQKLRRWLNIPQQALAGLCSQPQVACLSTTQSPEFRCFAARDAMLPGLEADHHISGYCKSQAAVPPGKPRRQAAQMVIVTQADDGESALGVRNVLEPAGISWSYSCRDGPRRGMVRGGS